MSTAYQIALIASLAWQLYMAYEVISIDVQLHHAPIGLPHAIFLAWSALPAVVAAIIAGGGRAAQETGDVLLDGSFFWV